MTKKTSETSSSKKTMDVSRPGKSAPSASSRPIVVTHKPMMSDPMVKDNASAEPKGAPAVEQAGTTVKTLLNPNKPRIKVSPLTEEDKTELAAATASRPVHDPGSVVKPQDADEEKAPDASKVPDEPKKSEENDKESENGDGQDHINKEKPEEPKPAKDVDAEEPGGQANEENQEDKPEPTDDQPQSEGIVDELAKQAADKKKIAQQDKEDAARQGRIDSLVSSKTYNVPIGQLTKRRHAITFLLILMLIIVLGLVGVNFAIDAGLIKTDIQPLTDVIKN